MKKLNITFTSNRLMQKLTAYLAATATVAMVGLAIAAWPGHANAAPTPPPPPPAQDKAQGAEVLQLLADFHGALSYGGDITAMASLWADDSSITLNGTPHVGKAAVLAFFTGNGYFLNDWVSLAPEYKTEITIHGNTAVASTQCVAIDVNPASATFHQVKSVIQVNAVAMKLKGQWVFISMDNTSGATL